jgi:uncharacterized protein involved in response to NO
MRSLSIVVAALGIGELVTAVINWREHTPDSEPVLLALFALPWLAAYLLLRAGRIATGAIVSGLLCALIAVSFMGWRHHTTLDRIWQIGYAAVALGGLVLSIVVLLDRSRSHTAQTS